MDRYDKLQVYCRMLGHGLSFQYCRTVNNGLPCARIVDCWFERIPVQQFVEQHYTKEQLQVVFAPPKPKVVSLFELIEKARKNTD